MANGFAPYGHWMLPTAPCWKPSAAASSSASFNGLRNRDLQRLLFETQPDSPQEVKRRSAQMSRKLRMLRAHGLLQKVPRTHRYQVTAAGRKAITAILTARQASVAQLTKVAA